MRTCLGRLSVTLLVAAVLVGCARIEVAQCEPRQGQQSLIRDGVPVVYSRQRELLGQFQAGKRPVYVPGQPTDDTLDHARAAVYGQLVMAAYKMYEPDPTKLRPTPCCIPAGYKFVAWVQMRDFFFGNTDWKFYGILTVNTLKTNEYVLAIRGTEGWEEWFDDSVSMILVPLPRFGGKVGAGFLKIYQTIRVVCPPLGKGLSAESLEREGSFAEQVAAAIRHCAGRTEPANIVVTGHSLGGALATLFVADNVAHQPSDITIFLICTFASPKVGDYDFAVKFNDLGVTSWRIVDEPDVIPMLFLFGFYHVQTEYPFSSLSFVVWTLPCFHYLETYLHWLDPNQPLKPCCVWPNALKPCCVWPSAARTAQLRSRAALFART